MGAFQLVGTVIDGRWEIRRRRTNLHNDAMYDVRDNRNLTFATFWVEFVQWPVHILRNEALICKELTTLGLSSIPEFISYGETDRVRYLCTKPVGPLLEALHVALPPVAEGQFSLCTCLHIGLQTLFTMKEFHDAGYVHRCLAPGAFALDKQAMNFFLLPCGMSKRWRNFQDDGQLPTPSQPAPFRGCLRYCSVGTLRKKHQWRLDDLWSWFYMLYDLTMGTLPWPPFQGDNTYEQLLNFATAKEAVHSSNWLDNAPVEYKEILKYLTTAAPECQPDYDRLSRLLSNALARAAPDSGDQLILDWEPGGRYYDSLQPIVANDQ